MSMEAALLFLEKTRTKCCTLPKYIWYLSHFWHCVLANWFNNVSIAECSAILIFINSKLTISNKKLTFLLLHNSKEEQDVFNILGIAYASALFLGLVNCSTLQPIVAMEKVVFYREKASDMYSSMAYVIAQVYEQL